MSLMNLMIFLIDLVFLRLDLIDRLPVLQDCGESSFFDELLGFLVFLDFVCVFFLVDAFILFPL